MNIKLTPREIAAIRKSDKPDSFFVKRYGVARLTILRARLGQTHKAQSEAPRKTRVLMKAPNGMLITEDVLKSLRSTDRKLYDHCRRRLRKRA